MPPDPPVATDAPHVEMLREFDGCQNKVQGSSKLVRYVGKEPELGLIQLLHVFNLHGIQFDLVPEHLLTKYQAEKGNRYGGKKENKK